MTWHQETEPNLPTLPPFHGLRHFNNGRLHLFVFTLVPEFQTNQIPIQDLRIELQKTADAYIRKNYPDIAGNTEELADILHAALDAQTSSESIICLLYTSPSPRDRTRSRMPSSA